MEPVVRIELTTSSLPRKRSTPELHWRSWSGRRGSNPRPSAWKADALPTELLPQFSFLSGDFFVGLRVVSRSLPQGNSLLPHSSASKSLKNKLRLCPWQTPLFKVKARSVPVRAFCGRRWIRTTEGINQQIYSLPHLATLVFSQNS